jgi:aryl-alcohol dehydrogenase-like predicted oxidoreductase
MRIGLGTAQFGLDYGITNGVRIDEPEVSRILDAARNAGINLLDTAHCYGTSEKVLAPYHADFRIVTKGASREDFMESLAKFGRVHGLLAHQGLTDDLWEAMVELKGEALIEKIGVSVYEGWEIDAVLDRYPIDIIQVPFNPLDQRLIEGGQLERLHKAGVEIHARSIFLQGLLLSDDYPAHLTPIKEAADEMRQGMDRLEWVLATVLSCPYIDCFICGVTSVGELMEIMAAAETRVRINHPPPRLDPRYLNPARWQELV